ncbi:hypothetical protein SVIOM74S_00732 [Streptomyces violarus]
MARPVSRRTLLQAAAIAAAAPALSETTAGRAAAAPAAAVVAAAAMDVPSAWTVRLFDLEDVSLGRGVFADKRQLMLDHARGYDVNRLLQVFRANAGLATGGAVAPGGWEGLDGSQRQSAGPLHRPLPDHAGAGVSRHEGTGVRRPDRHHGRGADRGARGAAA